MSEPMIPFDLTPENPVAWAYYPPGGFRNVFARNRIPVLRAAAEAAERDHREWVERVRQRYGLVTADDGMPREPCGMTSDGQYEGWYLAMPDGLHNPGVWRKREPAWWDGLTDWQKLGALNEMSLREQQFFAPDEGWERLMREIPERMRGGTITRGRQYETDMVHPPEWRPR